MPYTTEVAKAVDGYTARTIPVHASLEARQVVLSAPEMRALLGDAQLIAVGNCECRQKRRNCAAPLDVCLSLNGVRRKCLHTPAHDPSRWKKRWMCCAALMRPVWCTWPIAKETGKSVRSAPVAPAAVGFSTL